MYEQLDGILTWGDLVCAGCAKVRSPWVPLHRPPDRPRYLNLSLVNRNLGPPDRSCLRGLPCRFWSDFGPLREALEGQKHCKI